MHLWLPSGCHQQRFEQPPLPLPGSPRAGGELRPVLTQRPPSQHHGVACHSAPHAPAAAAPAGPALAFIMLLLRWLCIRLCAVAANNAQAARVAREGSAFATHGQWLVRGGSSERAAGVQERGGGRSERGQWQWLLRGGALA